MKFAHQHEHFNGDGIMIIECSQQCNVHLMNDANFRSFKNGGRHSYRGGASDRFPAKIRVPNIGFQDTTIDTVARHSISMTRKPNFKWSIKFMYRPGPQFT